MSGDHLRAVCSRWQEVRGERLVFSCECSGNGCPDARPVTLPPGTFRVDHTPDQRRRTS